VPLNAETCIPNKPIVPTLLKLPQELGQFAKPNTNCPNKVDKVVVRKWLNIISKYDEWSDSIIFETLVHSEVGKFDVPADPPDQK
jgi:hypothetical protein